MKHGRQTAQKEFAVESQLNVTPLFRPGRVENPFLREWSQLNKNFELRNYFITKYSYAVPNAEALEKIAEYGPIIEIGAGAGYWASLLRKMKVDITPIDRAPPGSGVRNLYSMPFEPWTKVLTGGPECVPSYPKSSLFLCWPPPDPNPMAELSLLNYRGRHVIFVGELFGGDTGSFKFYDELKKKFALLSEVAIPRWSGLQDTLTVWERM